uniref:Uncharacterized protein n=1 Tax=Romanomermis culicivorax TaxID=13658 RepID=A0A915KIC7_ROMCU
FVYCHKIRQQSRSEIEKTLASTLLTPWQLFKQLMHSYCIGEIFIKIIAPFEELYSSKEGIHI